MLPSVPLRQVARIDNNLNQIVRWANTYASEAEVGEVGAHWLGSVRTAAISNVNRLLQTVYIFRDGALPPIMSTGAKRISLPATGAYVGNPSSPSRRRKTGWRIHLNTTHSESCRGLSKPAGVHLNFALGLSNEVGPLHS